ncbi:hypothetical protein LCGC14_3032340 [marine sediment metagenome]|uniref:Uncharacterized protein n=1 Tax=marine sediment metagenome TaxID=412755 RepID=A0A0F8YZV0_9ZZZZ
MDKLIKNLIEIVEPLTKDETIPEDIRGTIISGYNILTDINKGNRERIQLSCDIFDDAQYEAYNPFHARVQLSKAIAIQEQFTGKQFERTKKSKLTN